MSSSAATNRREQLPRVFQANVDRLYGRVILPALASLTVHDVVSTGEASTMDEFLDRAKKQVDNYTANEARKVFALVLIALFERQLRDWAQHIRFKDAINIERKQFLELFDVIAADTNIHLSDRKLRETLEEAFEVGNVVRHGQGRASRKIEDIAEHLINRSGYAYVDLLPPPSPNSEWLVIGSSDIERYARAIVEFWGIADPLPGAMTNWVAPQIP